MKLGDCQPGDIVVFTGTVTRHDPSTTQVRLEGIGKTGEWAIANSADVLAARLTQLKED